MKGDLRKSFSQSSATPKAGGLQKGTLLGFFKPQAITPTAATVASVSETTKINEISATKKGGTEIFLNSSSKGRTSLQMASLSDSDSRSQKPPPAQKSAPAVAPSSTGRKRKGSPTKNAVKKPATIAIAIANKESPVVVNNDDENSQDVVEMHKNESAISFACGTPSSDIKNARVSENPGCGPIEVESHDAPATPFSTQLTAANDDKTMEAAPVRISENEGDDLNDSDDDVVEIFENCENHPSQSSLISSVKHEIGAEKNSTISANGNKMVTKSANKKAPVRRKRATSKPKKFDVCALDDRKDGNIVDGDVQPLRYGQQVPKKMRKQKSAAFKEGSAVDCLYGTGIIKSIREDGIHVVECQSWVLANNTVPTFYLNKEVLTVGSKTMGRVRKDKAQNNITAAGYDTPVEIMEHARVQV